MHPPWRWSGSSGTGFDSQSVVYGNPELLLASEVAFGCLDGDVAEQELDLIQFTTGEMAETGAGAPQVVRSQLVDRGTSRWPTRSAITQCSSRCWIDPRLRANSSARRRPHPINIATIA